MTRLSGPARRRRRVAIDFALVLVIVVLMVQMWLLTATLESYLAGHHGAALPALLSSLGLFGVCVLLYRLVIRIDRMPERTDEHLRPGAGPWRIGSHGAHGTHGSVTVGREASRLPPSRGQSPP